MTQTGTLTEPELPTRSEQQHFGTDHLLPLIERRTVRGSVVTIASHGLKFSISLVATGIMARLLTPEDYGLVGMVAVVTTFASLFKDLGFSHATVQTPKITERQISALLWINLALSVVIAAVVAGLAPVVAWFYEEPRLTSITLVVSLGFILGGLTVQHEALLKRQMRFVALSATALASMLCGYAVGITFAALGAGYWELIFGQLTLLSVNALGVWILCGWRPNLPQRNSGIRSLLSFGGNVTGYSTIKHFAGNADSLLIGRFWEATNLGFYAKALQLLALPTEQVNEPIAVVTVPALSRLNHSPLRYRQAYFRIMEKVLLLTMPCMAFMIASADWLVHLILGPQWSATAKIFVFLGVAGLLQPVANTIDWLLVSQGRAQHMLYWSIISAPISIGFIAAGLPWGATGVAASFSIGRLCVLYPLMYWFVGRTGPIRTGDFYTLIAPFVGASVCVLIACMTFRFLVNPTNHIIATAANLGITCITALLVLALIPSGRLALRDTKRAILVLFGRPQHFVPAGD
jgi:PST family polysaccharide transporter